MFRSLEVGQGRNSQRLPFSSPCQQPTPGWAPSPLMFSFIHMANLKDPFLGLWPLWALDILSTIRGDSESLRKGEHRTTLGYYKGPGSS